MRLRIAHFSAGFPPTESRVHRALPCKSWCHISMHNSPKVVWDFYISQRQSHALSDPPEPALSSRSCSGLASESADRPLGSPLPAFSAAEVLTESAAAHLLFKPHRQAFFPVRTLCLLCRLGRESLLYFLNHQDLPPLYSPQIPGED